MAENRIRVLLVHAFPDTTAYITALLGLERDISLEGSVANGSAGLKQASEAKPDVILVGSELPDTDSAGLVRQITTKLPRTGVIVLVTADDPNELRRYMQAGARSFLVMPFSSEQLAESIRDVYRRMRSVKVAAEPRHSAPAGNAGQGKLVAVFGPKGGVGKSTLAANLAVALRRNAERKVALVDCSFSFGDLHLFFDIKPERTIVDFIDCGPDGDLDTLEQVLRRHSSGVALLARPVRPEHAEMITTDGLRHTLDVLTQGYDVTVLDCPASYDDRVLMALDRAHVIILIVTPDLGTLYNATTFLSLTRALGYSRERIMIVFNRYDSQGGASVKEVEDTLSHAVEFKVPSRWRDFSSALNSGVPYALSHPNSELARTLASLADMVLKKCDGQ
ncbi:MAG: response regulator [Chloroflexi bacterium]|nr:response regulator [Chloroflexota bacterium]